jgi:hypothetical protein
MITIVSDQELAAKASQRIPAPSCSHRILTGPHDRLSFSRRAIAIGQLVRT